MSDDNNENSYELQIHVEEQEEEVLVSAEEDVSFGFFSLGRELESQNRNHIYTPAEKKVLQSYEGLDYWPSNSKVYHEWLVSAERNFMLGDMGRWLVMGLIGFTVGILGFLMHQLIDLITYHKWHIALTFNYQDEKSLAFCFLVTSGLVLVIPAAALVILKPNAVGSGLPELIGYLNGTQIKRIFGLKNLWVKFFSCVFAVSSGLPVGPEAPMILIGSIIGSSISQFRSRLLNFELSAFKLLRNPEDQRNFISAGAAAGIASAFGAPIGGMLFALEEVSSYWIVELWQIFFCCFVSSFTTDVLNSAFTQFIYNGQFGILKTDLTILFKIKEAFDINILALVPCIILGVLGGILGSTFNFLNLKINRMRSQFHNLKPLKKTWNGYILKVLEPCLIYVIYISLTVWITGIFPPKHFICLYKPYQDIHTNSCEQAVGNNDLSDVMDSSFTYNVSLGTFPNQTKYQEGFYDQGAPLLFSNGEEAVKRLFSRSSKDKFDVPTLIIIFIIYFPLTCVSAGTWISSGIVVPSFILGGIYGRVLGVLLVDLFGSFQDTYNEWLDPGALALLGAVSFFGGVTRLTVSLTIIMVEMTNDIHFLLLIMCTVMVAKWTGDRFTHPLYHALLEVKCIPFLYPVARVTDPSAKKTLGISRPLVNLDLHTVKRVMASPVVALKKEETLRDIIQVLTNTSHGAFPVLNDDQGSQVGLISRLELIAIVKWIKREAPESMDTIVPRVLYEEIEAFSTTRTEFSGNNNISALMGKRVDLSDYINTTALKINEEFSLKRAYSLFNSLGLRHLSVVNERGQVKGMLTRKDLMGYNIQDKLFPLEGRREIRTTKGIENPNYEL